MLALAFLSVGSVGVVACAGAQSGSSADPQGSVSIGDYCERTGEATCTCLANTGGDSVAKGCLDGFIPSCVAGREASAPSGRTEAQTSVCETALETKCMSMLGGGLAECPPLTPPQE